MSNIQKIIGLAAVALLVGTTVASAQTINGQTARTMGGIRGTVYVGPTCPVVTFPPTMDCSPDLLPHFAMDIINRNGVVVASVETDKKGRFLVRLSAGAYTIQKMKDGASGEISLEVPPYLEPTNVVVKSHAWTRVELMADSGIR